MQLSPLNSKVLPYCNYFSYRWTQTTPVHFLVKEERPKNTCMWKMHLNIFQVTFQNQRVHVSADLHYLFSAINIKAEED